MTHLLLKSFNRVFLIGFMLLIFGGCEESTNSTIKNTSNTTSLKKYEPTQESLAQYQIPDWYTDAKFGIFIHWGVYSVPAFGSEWYPRLMYMDTATFSATLELHNEGPNAVFTHHKEKFGPQKKFGYKDFVPMFKAEKFDPVSWISVLKKSGAKYVIPVADHHDGFAMYDSKTTRWSSKKMGPKRDVLGELFKEGKKQGLIMGASSHYAFNWSFYNKKDHFDTVDPKFADLYSKKGKDLTQPVSDEFKQQWWDRTTDLIDNYQPDILWFDFYWDSPEWKDYHPKLASYYYNKGLERNLDVVIQNKNHHHESFLPGTFVADVERGKMANIKKHTWQTDTSIGKNSWGHVSNWETKDANTLIDDLIDIVSKNGTLLLNIGPKADGTIPADQEAILMEIGEWLEVNGDAIFGTRCWKTFGEGPTESEEGYFSETKKQDAFVSDDIRFTTKDGKLYAIVMDLPKNRKSTIRSLVKGSKHCNWDVMDVKMLGSQEKITWSQDDKGLNISFPNKLPSEYAYVFEINFGKNAKDATQNYITMKEK